MSFLCGKDLLKYVDVTGKKKTQIKVTQDVLRRLLVGMFIRFQHLHSEGKTLEGCFEAVNLFVPVHDLIRTPYIEVKLDSIPMEAFKPYTDVGGDKDLMLLGWIAENVMLSSETELSSDLAQLFQLLRTEPIKNKDLIYSHVSLKRQREKVSGYMWWYKRLLYLKKKEPIKYENIMQKIESAANCWRSQANQNKFLAQFNPYARARKGGYAAGRKGLGRFYRNCVEHLHMMSDDNERNSDPKPKVQASTNEEDEDTLEDYHVAIILTEAFPKYLGDLQMALHEEGELERFNAEDPSTPQHAVPAVPMSQC